MLTLLRREITDHLLLVTLIGIITLFLIWIGTYAILWATGPEVLVVALVLLVPALMIVYFGLGASQMYGDRANRVSTFLGTLAVTRNRLFAARVLVPALVVPATIVPLAVTAAILLRLAQPLAGLQGRMVAQVAVTIGLAEFACYGMGLLAGWTTSKAWLIVGGGLLLVLAASLVYIKGFGIEAMATLLSLIVASLGVAWYRFTSTSL